MRITVPALLGATRFRVVPRIGLRRHRPWAALNSKGSKRGALLLAALAISGCATTRYATAYCLTPPQLQKLKDAEPKRIGSSLTGQAQSDLKIIAANDLELRTYSDGLLGVLGGCVDPNKPVQ